MSGSNLFIIELITISNPLNTDKITTIEAAIPATPINEISDMTFIRLSFFENKYLFAICNGKFTYTK